MSEVAWPTQDELELLQPKSPYHPSVYRRGDVVHKEPKPWTPSVHALLRHLEAVGFEAAPRVVGSGFDDKGRETLTYIEGEFVRRQPWSEDACAEIGRLLRKVHSAVASFRLPSNANWFEWNAAELGGPNRLISHRDIGPWNIVAREGMPVALIDCERAGPVDPRVELAQACWLNARLHDDIVAERERLPAAAERARHLRAILEGYGLPRKQREGFVDLMIELVVYSIVEDADEFGLIPETKSQDSPPELVWAMARRARSVAWMMRNRRLLETAL